MCKQLLNRSLMRTALWSLRSFGQIKSNQLFNKPLKNGTVIISLSNDIYSNLALEEWLFKRIRFEDKQCLLLMWTNDRTLVCGRHQNLWDECHVNVCRSNGVNLCRRQSGGGTVYHDFNNLNISFFTNKKCYNRRSNLSFLKDVLKQCYNIDCEISQREDLVLKDGGFKISGTASKLASDNSYHHCTLLVDVDLNLMRKVIRKQFLNIESKATKSVPSSVKNLSSISREICIQSLKYNLAQHFQRIHNNNEFIYELYAKEELFPGIDEIVSNLKSWDWIYGKTPRFNVKFNVESTSSECILNVYHGVIESIQFDPPIDNPPELIGIRFTVEDVDQVLNEWTNSSNPIEFSKLVQRSIIKAINGVYS